MRLLGWPEQSLACYHVVVRMFLAGTIRKNSMIWDPILSVLSEIVSLVAKKKEYHTFTEIYTIYFGIIAIDINKIAPLVLPAIRIH